MSIGASATRFCRSASRRRRDCGDCHSRCLGTPRSRAP